ncbi:hypothetical protein Amsp01_009650 [Amycolatopsis sp. NBRC 101858]|nr:hypothetical protein Amsp01_009650 [Amycolatopsis sp. NBRC 101858]
MGEAGRWAESAGGGLGERKSRSPEGRLGRYRASEQAGRGSGLRESRGPAGVAGLASFGFAG